MKKTVPFLIGIGELQRQVSRVIKKIDAKHEEGFIVSHNEPKAVLMSLRRYHALRLLEELRHAEEENLLKNIDAGDEEFAAGKTKTAGSLKQFL